MSFEPERARIRDASGPGVLAGVNTATIGADKIFRDARETEKAFLSRTYKLARQRGIRVAAIEGLLLIDGGRSSQ